MGLINVESPLGAPNTLQRQCKETSKNKLQLKLPDTQFYQFDVIQYSKVI